jgi:hypothetical protein
MLDQVFDNFRKASQSTLEMQQDLFKQWVNQWSATPPAPATASAPAGAGAGAAPADQVHEFQKRWLESVTDLMNKHRESLDAQYKAGIRAIEEAFQLTEAKTPEAYRKISEDLWRQGFESVKNSADTQVRVFQAAVEKWFELIAKAKV